MSFTPLDWSIVVAYFVLTALIGFWFTGKASESVSEYFVSGRKVPWWLAGISMVATTFAADTPLAVTGFVAAHGVAGNWIWWNFVMGGVLTVFFFARLWRRAGVMTDAELAEVRYGGKPAAILRGFRAMYLALPINLIIVGWVTAAMIRILSIALGIDPLYAVGVCFLFTAAYAVAGGMWAALWTDVFQFVLKMSAVIILAVYAVDKVGGIDALRAGVTAHFGTDAALSVLPVHSGFTAYAWMPMLTLATFLSVQWWAAWYPGAEPGGGGYIAQRIFSAKSEKDGILATLLFQVSHYALRPWPWIITGLATIILYPGLTTNTDRENAYIHAFVDLLPTPWRGIMLAGFFAAYMSTIATQLNWGASYLVNDVYKRFVKPNAPERELVKVARLATFGLFILGCVAAWQIKSVEGAWKFLLALGAGTGLVLILRWYWWRINAWSEISSMIASFVISIVAMKVVPGYFPAGDPRIDSVVLLVTAFGSMLVWIPVTFLTQPESDATLRSFYERVRPGGPGWERVSSAMGYGREKIPGGALNWTNWIAGVIAVYSSLFGIGKIVFGEYAAGLGFFALATVCFVWIARNLAQVAPSPETPG
ncbi:MAG TPA: sodium:solute symporter family protein [Gemmatimonadaceae bacterium]|nr:sodium:solute symporter family protein [Gemmatimonadaceae bacterium]